MTALLQKIKSRPLARDGVFEKLLRQKKLSRRKYKELLEVRGAWRSGDIAVGSGAIAEEIIKLIGTAIPRTTVAGWLGRKGQHAS